MQRGIWAGGEVVIGIIGIAAIWIVAGCWREMSMIKRVKVLSCSWSSLIWGLVLGVEAELTAAERR